ncbi:MAG: DUF1028 domain-containing protein [Anaerolineales bacterium]|nr:DUF1028 domain-containing protein [Anaerolineales bacterium]
MRLEPSSPGKPIPFHPVATFSIVAFDPDTRSLGVAVASKFPAAGAVVPWVKAECCAVATQSYANTSFGPEAFKLVTDGKSAKKTLDILLQADEQASLRQVGIVDFHGEAATYTGAECQPWAGGYTGRQYAVQGNILTGPETIDAMRSTFESSTEAFPERLLAALLAGDRAGGDRRGRQSAAIYIARADAGYGGFNDRWIDYRVDDHTDPVPRLQHLLRLHRLYFEQSEPSDRMSLENALPGLYAILVAHGQLEQIPEEPLHPPALQALRSFIGSENFEERIDFEEGWIDRPVYIFLQETFLKD